MALVILFFGTVVLFPDKVAEKVDEILVSFEDQGIEFSVQSGKLILGRTKAEVRAALEAQEMLDAIREKATCLTNFKCDEDQQKALSELMNFESVAVASGQPDNSEIGVENLDGWVVIFGSYPTLNGAYEGTEDLNGEELPVEVVHMNNRYRPVAVFTSKEDAENSLEVIRQRTGQFDAYIRLFPSWCSSPNKVMNPKLYYECT